MSWPGMCIFIHHGRLNNMLIPKQLVPATKKPQAPPSWVQIWRREHVLGPPFINPAARVYITRQQSIQNTNYFGLKVCFLNHVSSQLIDK